MALLRDAAGKLRTLGARTILGRSKSCAIRLTAPHVSGEHACVYWTAAGWWVRDLGSTNGTWVDERRVEPGRRARLAAGETITLGAGHGPTTFVLVDASAPGIRAVDVKTSTRVGPAEDLLQLPSDVEPTWTIYDDGRTWIVERGGREREIEDQEVLGARGRRWRIELPARLTGNPIESTKTEGLGATPIELCTMRFVVSSDEEEVRVSLGHGRKRILLVGRVFHYLLLTLARARLEDRRRGVRLDDEGWMHPDDLARRFRTTKPKLNLDVCRAKRQVASTGILGGGRLVERRVGSTELRLGVAELEVIEARQRTQSQQRAG